MKKLAIALLVFIAILFVILLLKIKGVFPIIDFPRTANTTTSSFTPYYSDDDIQNLIIQGAETMENSDNWSFEVENLSIGPKYPTWIEKYYYKGEKSKKELYFNHENTASVTYIADTAQETLYDVQHKQKSLSLLHISPNQATSYVPKEQCSFAKVVKGVKKSINLPYKYVFTHIGDDELEGKDCILAKKEIIYLDEARYPESVSDFVIVYWIEKSTGFILGRNAIEIDETTPVQIIRNISFGNVKDSDFEMPVGYTVN